MVRNEQMTVSVLYAASADKQTVISVNLPAGATIRQAIEASGICVQYPEIDLFRQRVGIFSELRTLTDVLQAGDRVEIYRPLTVDPKEARRLREKKKSAR